MTPQVLDWNAFWRNPIITGSSLTPTADNSISLGLQSKRWSDVQAVTATFSGLVTFNGGFTGTLTGNAATATKLQTARTINGVSFDGTANITVTAAAGTLTGSALAGTVTSSSLTSVGTLAALTVTAVITGSVNGNAGTATALQTARAINGVNFDGSAAITITSAAGTLTGATLAANVLASSLTSLGTIAALVAGTISASGTISHTGINVFLGNQTAAPTNVTLGALGAGNNDTHLKFIGSSIVNNWEIAANSMVGGELNFTPSTAGGGSIFTTPILRLLTTGAVVTGTLVVSGGITGANSAQAYGTTSRGSLGPSADGVWQFGNNAGTGFTRLNFGGATASFPALNVSGTTLQCVLADNSADANFSAKNLVASGGFGCNTKSAQTAFASGGAAPAGGTGATAGAYDTAAHRDALITLVNNIRSALVANGIMS